MKGVLHITIHATPRVPPEARARDFLQRQNAWFETLLRRLENAASGQAALAAFIADEPALNEERSRYDREAEEIRVEWSTISGTVSAETRAELDALARRGEGLVSEIQGVYARVIRDVEEQADDTRAALRTLVRGRNIVRRYAFGNPDDALYIDRKA